MRFTNKEKMMSKVLLALVLSFGLVSVCYAAGPWSEVTILAGTSEIGSIRTGTNTIGGIKDAGPNYTCQNKWASGSTAQTRTTLWTPAAGTKAVVTDIIISADTALRFDLLDASSVTVFSPFYVAASSTADIHLRTPIKSGAADNVVAYSTDIDGNFSIQLLGYEE